MANVPSWVESGHSRSAQFPFGTRLVSMGMEARKARILSLIERPTTLTAGDTGPSEKCAGISHLSGRREPIAPRRRQKAYRSELLLPVRQHPLFWALGRRVMTKCSGQLGRRDMSKSSWHLSPLGKTVVPARAFFSPFRRHSLSERLGAPKNTLLGDCDPQSYVRSTMISG
jgi:hypothetical protein